MPKSFKKEIRLSGSGGQGLITAGIILAKAAVIENFQVTQSQSYGPESRGGASRADVLISDNKIYFPEAIEFDILLALTQKACDKYIIDLKEEGILIADSTYVKSIEAEHSNKYLLPFTQIAEDKLGTSLPTNILSLGFIAQLTKVVSKKALETAVAESVKPQFIELNMKALKIGYSLAKKEQKSRG